MSIESRELSDLRRDIFAAESFIAGQQLPPEEKPEPEPNEPNGVCKCCGKRRYIPPMMHVCIPCFEESE